MRNLAQWVAGERAEILARRAAMRDGLASLPGWKTLGCGAYFAYVEHPSPLPAPDFARQLVRDAGVLLLPGTMFMPDTDPAGARQLRIAFANVDSAGIAQLMDRLRGLSF
jgi:aspartate/methionine/tyrosine aminotransferase